MTKKTTKTPNKKTLSKEATKEKLLNSGLEIFSKYGFEAATTKKIATHAGVNEALINRYFKGKAGLLEAIFVKHIINVQLKVRDYPTGSTVEEDIRNFIECAYLDAIKNPKVLKIIFSLMVLDSKLQKKVHSVLEIPNKKFLGRLQEFQKKKQIHSSRNLYDIIDAVNLFISSLVNDKILLRVSLQDNQRNIEIFARMIAREFKYSE